MIQETTLIRTFESIIERLSSIEFKVNAMYEREKEEIRTNPNLTDARFFGFPFKYTYALNKWNSSDGIISKGYAYLHCPNSICNEGLCKRFTHPHVKSIFYIAKGAYGPGEEEENCIMITFDIDDIGEAYIDDVLKILNEFFIFTGSKPSSDLNITVFPIVSTFFELVQELFSLASNMQFEMDMDMDAILKQVKLIQNMVYTIKEESVWRTTRLIVTELKLIASPHRVPLLDKPPFKDIFYDDSSDDDDE